MTDFLHSIDERIRVLGGDWAKYSVVGSFLLYVTGYLVLRFHLTAIGIATDLAVLDERYIFGGTRFIVYCVAAIPNIVMVALPVILVVWIVCRWLPPRLRQSIRNWFATPEQVVVFGIVFSVCTIQFVMRQCFFFGDLLLSPALPEQPAWLGQLLLNDRLMPLYFSALVAATCVPLVILWASRESPLGTFTRRFARSLLGILAAIQILLLPVNYGVLVVDKSMPRVAAVGSEPLAVDDEAWLVWEGKDSVTYLIRNAALKRRSLLTLPRSDVKRVEVVGFDRILPRLFAPEHRSVK
jgi:hypothetical protein